MMKSIFTTGLLCLSFILLNGQDNPKPDRDVFHHLKAVAQNRGSFTYMFTVLNEPYTDLSNPISINNGDVWDDPAYAFSIPFPFELNGHAISTLEFYGTGALLRSPTTDPDIYTYVFPFELDLIDRGSVTGISASPISYQVEGPSGNRILKVEMKNAGSFYEFDELGTTDMYMNLQMWLFEGSNRVEFHFGESLISDPDIFFADGGAYCGITDANEASQIFINGHFLGGPASAPQLSMSDVTLEGNPDDGTVYRFFLSPPVEITVTGTNATSFCQPNGTATVEVTGGSSPYTYQWNTGGNTPTIENLDAGTYTVTVSDANGEMATGSVTITGVNPLNPNAGATDETGPGLNDGTAFAAPFGGTPPYDYNWSNGATTQSITGLSPGIYTVLVTDDAGCSATQDVSVNAFGCPAFDVEAIVVHVSCAGWCNGQISILDVSGGVAPYTYLWSNGSTASAIGNLCQGTYFLTVEDSNGCVEIKSYDITEPPALIADAGASNQVYLGMQDGTAWALPSGGTPPYSYLWNNGGIDSLITGLAPGAYYVTISDANGCLDSQSVVVLPVICALELNSFTINPSCADVCDGVVVTDVTGGTGNYNYVWSNGVASATVTDLCSTDSLILVVHDLGNGCSVTDSFTLTSPPALDATFHITDYTDISAGAIDIKMDGGVPPYFYAWSGPNGYVSDMEDISGLVPGYYSVLVTDQNGCSWAKDSLEIKDLTVGIQPLNQLHIKIYPNPADQIVYIGLEDATGYHISILTLDGKTVMTRDDQNRIDVSRLTPGLYVLEGISNEGIFRERLMITR